MGDEGAFPVRSVEKGDRGGYGVVAWVCVVLVLVERGWKERRREQARRSPEGWRETNDKILRRSTERNEHEWRRTKERERWSKGCEGDDTIEEEQRERGAGQ